MFRFRMAGSHMVTDWLQDNDNGNNKEEWVYTGSTFSDDGIYLAKYHGTLIGFAHDPASIIEHQGGLGLRHYGAIVANAQAPPPGTKINLSVFKIRTSCISSYNLLTCTRKWIVKLLTR